MTCYHVELVNADPIEVTADRVRIVDAGALVFFLVGPPPDPLQPVAMFAPGTWTACHTDTPTIPANGQTRTGPPAASWPSRCTSPPATSDSCKPGKGGAECAR
jgi:hypothetical protein